MSAPQHPSAAASALGAVLTVASVALLCWVTVEVYRFARRPRRWPRPRRRNGGRPW